MKPIDIEGALASYFNDSGVPACAPPLTGEYADLLPFVLFTRVGGEVLDRVINRHSVSVDVYGSTWAEAMSSANDAAEMAAGIEGRMLDGVQVYAVEANLPYTNPDPAHPNIPRCTFSVGFLTKSK